MDAPTCLITPRPYEFFPFFMFASGRRVSSSFWCKNYVSRPHASRHRRVLRDVKLTVNSFFSFYLYLWSNRKLLFDEKVSKSDKKQKFSDSVFSPTFFSACRSRRAYFFQGGAWRKGDFFLMWLSFSFQYFEIVPEKKGLKALKLP